MKNVTEIISATGKVADDLVSTDEERQLQLTERHKIDMNSDSWLSKNIRPIALVFLMLCQLLIVLAEMFNNTVSDAVIIQVGSLLGGAMGFYFYSRRIEKVATKNADANIEIEKLKTKAKIREERRQAKHERKLERQEAK